MLSSTFDIFSKVILEKNYSYSIPQDKELILYDFYMIVHLNALKKEGKFKPGDKFDHFGQQSQTATRSMGLDHSTEFSFEEIKKQLIGYLQPELLEASLFSISCELRHVFDNNTPLNITATLGPKIAEFYTNLKYNYEKLKSLSTMKRNADSTIKDLINKRRRKFNKKYNIKMKEGGASRNTDYKISYKALKQTIAKLNISEVEVAEIGRKSFLSLQWGNSYGGKPWASICDAYIKLYYAKREVDQIIYIDNMYHQQHNTDTVFNKLQSYYKSNAGYRWVLNALNFKADVKDNWDRIKKIKEVATIKVKDASGNVTKEIPALRSIDRMYIEMLKASGDRTWEQYYKVEKSPQKKSDPFEQFHDIQGNTFSASKYLPPKTSYQEVPPHSTSADDLNILQSRSHWNMMAKNGFKKFGKIYNSSGNELISVGPGVNAPPYLMGLLNITSSNLFIQLDSGKWSGSNEGSSPSHNYAVPKDIWVKKFGKLPKELQHSHDAATNWKDMAIEGFKKFGKIVDAGGNKLIYIGPGSKSNGGWTNTLNLDPSNMYIYISSENKWVSYNSGNEPNAVYAIPVDIWIEKFGKLPKELSTRSSKTKYTPNPKYVSKFIAAAKQTDPDIYKKGFIYIGYGVNEGLIEHIGVEEIDGCNGYLFATDMMNKDPNSQCPDLFGTLTDEKYYLKKSHWEDIFGPFEKMTGYEEKADKFKAIKKYFIKVAKEFNDESSFEEATAGSQSFWVSLGNSIPKHLADPEDIQNGATITLSNIIGGNDNSLIRKISKNIGRIEHSNSGYYISDWGGDGILGAQEGYQYVMKKTIWESLFGKFKPSETEDDANSTELTEFTKKEIDDFHSLVTQGEKKYGEDINNKHWMYVGTVGHVKKLYESGKFKEDIFSKPKLVSTAMYTMKLPSDENVTWIKLRSFDNVNDLKQPVIMYKDIWEEYFGEYKPTAAKKESVLTPEVIKKYQKLAKSGHKRFSSIPQVKDYITLYVGTVLDVLDAINNGIFTKQLVSDYFFGSWATGDNWSGISTMKKLEVDLSPGTTIWMKRVAWTKLFGPIEDLIDSSDTKQQPTVSQEIKTKFINLAKEGYKMGNNEAYDGTPLIYIGKGKLSESGIPTNLTKLSNGNDIYGIVGNNKVPTPGWTGGDKTKDYFITAQKWQELFGEEPPEKTEEKNSSSPKVSRQTLKKFENLAVDGYKKGHYKNKYGENLVYIGKGPIGEKGLPDTNIIYDVHAVAPDTKTDDGGYYILSGHWSGDKKDKDYFLTTKDWTALFGIHPPADLYI